MWLAQGVIVTCLGLACVITLQILLFVNRRRTRRRHYVREGVVVVGFFHPYCNAGGGGERVLWRAIHALARLSAEHERGLHIVVYTGDVEMSSAEILANVQRQFNISLDPSLHVSFEYLRGRGLLEAARYPVITMLGQSMGSMGLAVEALLRATPDVFVDTTGLAFTFPLAWAAGCTVGTYVHYPTISTVSWQGVAEAFETGVLSRLLIVRFRLRSIVVPR